ncbi:hypothetical protein [Xanthomonas fragariae]|uniref:hypothetical protein n=1 Tax=Xanthomonas fragariae TaxID=48664 RepID=UPI0022AB2758|nr:hypothetical protein [Xanthomonas fragariae]WAT15815.1 hypothetical protein OZ429_05475 [Xanthomonas fragariae]
MFGKPATPSPSAHRVCDRSITIIDYRGLDRQRFDQIKSKVISGANARELVVFSGYR